jgi:cytochrome c biogenesis protein
MSTSENTDLGLPAESVPTTKTSAKKPNILDRVLKQLSSVPFGVSLLVLMIILSMTGMLIMQVNVDGFAEYYASLTPSQQWLYTDPILRALRSWTGLELRGWNIFSLVDIYKSYVFITLLAIVSLNIILASIDHFPGAWRYITRKKLTATKPYVLHRPHHVTLESDESQDEPLRIASVLRAFGYRATVTREAKRTTVFGERGAWNRLGAYFVHVGLLTIFLGGFFTWRHSHNGMLTLVPGMEARTVQGLAYDLDKMQVQNYALPFEVECTDIQQLLIRPEDGLEANNTVDWHTRIRVVDGDKVVEGDVHMNRPFDYRGYRFFQSSYQNVANARTVGVVVERPGAAPERLDLMRGQPAVLADGTEVAFLDFTGDIDYSNKNQSIAPTYDNPAAVLRVTRPGAEPARVVALTAERAALDPSVATQAGLGDAKITLASFEKVGGSHTLAVQYDPWGAWSFYVGSVILIAALIAVFFFAHQRFWFVIERDKDGKMKVFAGGQTNRNRPAFDRTFKDVVAALSPRENTEVKA